MNKIIVKFGLLCLIVLINSCSPQEELRKDGNNSNVNTELKSAEPIQKINKTNATKTVEVFTPNRKQIDTMIQSIHLYYDDRYASGGTTQLVAILNGGFFHDETHAITRLAVIVATTCNNPKYNIDESVIDADVIATQTNNRNKLMATDVYTAIDKYVHKDEKPIVKMIMPDVLNQLCH